MKSILSGFLRLTSAALGALGGSLLSAFAGAAAACAAGGCDGALSSSALGELDAGACGALDTGALGAGPRGAPDTGALDAGALDVGSMGSIAGSCTANPEAGDESGATTGATGGPLAALTGLVPELGAVTGDVRARCSDHKPVKHNNPIPTARPALSGVERRDARGVVCQLVSVADTADAGLEMASRGGVERATPARPSVA